MMIEEENELERISKNLKRAEQMAQEVQLRVNYAVSRITLSEIELKLPLLDKTHLIELREYLGERIKHENN